MSDQGPIVLFDGKCNLCNGTVRFLSKRDAQGILRYANLQSHAGKRLLELYSLPTEIFDSFVFVEANIAHQRSDGALRALRHLTFPWPLAAGLLRIVPRFARNWVYDWIARNRYAWFGTTAACQIPSIELQSKFLS